MSDQMHNEGWCTLCAANHDAEEVEFINAKRLAAKEAGRAASTGAGAAPPEPVREALADMIAHDEDQRDNCGDWGTDTCLIREKAKRALAPSSTAVGLDPDGIDWDNLAALISDALDCTNDGAVVARAIRGYLTAGDGSGTSETPGE